MYSTPQVMTSPLFKTIRAVLSATISEIGPNLPSSRKKWCPGVVVTCCVSPWDCHVRCINSVVVLRKSLVTSLATKCPRPFSDTGSKANTLSPTLRFSMGTSPKGVWIGVPLAKQLGLYASSARASNALNSKPGLIYR